MELVYLRDRIMKNDRCVYLSMIILFSILTGCACNKAEEEDGPKTGMQQPSEPSRPTMQTAKPAFLGDFSGKVLETMDVKNYTYLHVDTGREKVWAAVPQCAVKVGDEVEIPKGMPMDQFHSETLDRTFDLIYFCQKATVKSGAETTMQGLPKGHPDLSAMKTESPAPDPASLDFSGLTKAEGGKTVAEIFADMDLLAGQEVIVRGLVVKYNKKILGQNWIHLKDGTGEAGTDDLTITTQGEAKVGDTVLARGTIILDKDFGFGYRYAVLLENAQITVE